MKKILSFFGALFLLIGISVDANALQLLLWGDSDARGKLKDTIIMNMISYRVFDCSGNYNPDQWEGIHNASMHKKFENEDVKFLLTDISGLPRFFDLSKAYICSAEVVVYACSSEDLTELTRRLTLIKESVQEECKVILVASEDTKDFLNSNISTIRSILGESLSEGSPLVVDPSDYAEINKLAERMLNLAYSFQVKRREKWKEEEKERKSSRVSHCDVI